MILAAVCPRYGGSKPCREQGRLTDPGNRTADRHTKGHRMSNPPVQPPAPDSPEPRDQKTPGYGQPPQYGQQAPQPPQYGQQAPGYGQSPYANVPPGQPQGPGGMPKMVNTAFWLIIGAGAVWVISLLLSLGSLDNAEFRSVFEQQMAAGGAAIDFDTVKDFIVWTIVAFAVISAGLYALVAFNVRKGKNWARILGTVFAALSLLNIAPLGIGSIAVVAGIAGIAMLYLPATSPYFQKQPFANPFRPGNPYGN